LKPIRRFIVPYLLATTTSFKFLIALARKRDDIATEKKIREEEKSVHKQAKILNNQLHT